ncbi:Hypothetical predicted protein [Podarcis lilfordi]|uniref:Uncharacterized protein n=1 Tax=Podarcis lilfordi TaxID=74358 RepID=A0AA35KKH8_9SAUR|nr:Hypothetical predicted protein [Podarcis lilfordi]
MSPGRILKPRKHLLPHQEQFFFLLKARVVRMCVEDNIFPCSRYSRVYKVPASIGTKYLARCLGMSSQLLQQ